MPQEIPLTPQEAEWYKSQGYDPSDIVKQIPDEQPTSSNITSKDEPWYNTVLKNLKAKAGGYAGGAAGALGTEALAAPFTEGMSLLPAVITAAGAGASALGWQKIQRKIEGPDLAKKLEQEAAESSEANPTIAFLTDAAASAYPVGGRPNIRLLSELKTALTGGEGANLIRGRLAGAGLVYPAINTGVQYALSGRLPTGSDLLQNAAAGLIFSGGKTIGGKPNTPDGSVTIDPNKTTSVSTEQQPTKNEVITPFTATKPDGTPQIDDKEIRSIFQDRLNPKPEQTGEYILDAQNKSNWRQQNALPVDQMRQALHEAHLADLAKTAPEMTKYEQSIPETKITTTPEEVADRAANEGDEQMDALRRQASRARIQQEVAEQSQKVRTGEALTQEQQTQEKAISDAQPNSSKEQGEVNRPSFEEVAREQAQQEMFEQKAKEMTERPSEQSNETPFLGKKKAAEITKSGMLQPDLTKTPGIDEWLQGLKAKGVGTRLSAGLQEIPLAVWNTSIDAVRASVKAGKAISDAIKDGIDWIKKNHPGIPFDENIYSHAIKDELLKKNSPSDEVKIPPIPGARTVLNAADKIRTIDNPLANKLADSIKLGLNNATERVGATVNKFDEGYVKLGGKLTIKEREDLNNLDSGNKITTTQKVADLWNLKNQIDKEQEQYQLNVGRPLTNEKPINNPDPIERWKAQWSKAAFADSYYKHIESDPVLKDALKGRTPFANQKDNDTARAALSQFLPEHTSHLQEGEQTISNAAVSAFVSAPRLSWHVLSSTNLQMFTQIYENPVQMSRLVAKIVTGMPEGIKRSFENGSWRYDTRDIGTILDRTVPASQKMALLGSILRKVTGRELAEKLAYGSMQIGFENALPKKIMDANNGNKTAAAFIKNLDPSYHYGKTYSLPEIQKLASYASQYTIGTKDARSMPAFMLEDTEASGFFKLSHWSIAQTNNFYKNVYTPLMNGDIKPFLVASLGSIAGGYFINEIKQQLSGKHGAIPSIPEIQAGNPINGTDKEKEDYATQSKELYAYNALAACQYSGFGGVLSQMGMWIPSTMFGDKPQGAIFPLDEILSDVFTNTKNAIFAARNDPVAKLPDIVSEFTRNILVNNVALAKTAINHGINQGIIKGTPADKKTLADKLEELQRFEKISSYPIEQISGADENPYMNLEQKKFKKEQDIPKAMSMLPPLIEQIVSSYSDKPDIMMKKLKSLKENPYETFPSLEGAPLEFKNYLNYLTKLKGPQAAQADLQDYMKHKIINEAKASAVP